MLIINEPGLYRLIFLSRKPEVERFKTWVFTQVLPQIRKSGSYGVDRERLALRSDRDTYKRLWLEARHEIKRYENRGFLTWDDRIRVRK